MADRYSLLTTAALMAITLQACGPSREVRREELSDVARLGSSATMLGSDGSIFTFGKDSSKAKSTGTASGITVNAYLWRGTLDTLSFMPLISADAFGGVIITDWFQPEAARGERFKATAYILGGDLRSDGVKISIFRQVQQNGQWLDAPVAPSTISEIENKILARARELRTSSGAS